MRLHRLYVAATSPALASFAPILPAPLYQVRPIINRTHSTRKLPDVFDAAQARNSSFVAGGWGSSFCNGDCIWDDSTPSGTAGWALTGTCRSKDYWPMTTTISSTTTAISSPITTPMPASTPVGSTPVVAPEANVSEASIADVTSSVSAAVGTVLATTVASSVVSSLGVSLSTSSAQSAAASSGGAGAALSLIYNVQFVAKLGQLGGGDAGSSSPAVRQLASDFKWYFISIGEHECSLSWTVTR